MNDIKDMNDEYGNDQNDHSRELCAWIETNNYFLKKENWNTLNRKVLTKIDIKLNKDIISQLVNGHQESIEKLLFEIRNKIDKIDQPDVLPLSATPNYEQGNSDDVKQPVNMNDDNYTETLTSENKNIQEFVAPSRLTISCVRNAIFYAAIWLFRIKKNVNEDKKVEVDQEDEHVPRQICIQLKQELREKDNLICTLNHQIAYLEGAMKLKDLRISGLMSKINSNSYSH
ncbi:hypothetical protein M0804_003252 [Polistes exclamans]|nr:hypothetical protein M0804_003252 [Polistes exclamans]